MELTGLFGRKRKPLLGLDVSSSAVKLIELSRSGGRLKVEAYRVLPLPANAVVEKNIKDVAAVADTIKRVISAAKTGARDAAVAVAGSAVITKVIDMPASLGELGLENQIAAEADQYVPYPLDEVALDYEVLGPSATNPDQIEVMLAACRRKTLTRASLRSKWRVCTRAWSMSRCSRWNGRFVSSVSSSRTSVIKWSPSPTSARPC